MTDDDGRYRLETSPGHLHGERLELVGADRVTRVTVPESGGDVEANFALGGEAA